MEVKKVGVLSLGKIMGLFGILYGLVSGILLVIAMSVSSDIPGMSEQFGIVADMGYYSIIAFPIINGIIYFVMGLIVALIYNVFSSWVGGVKIELRDKKK